MQTREIRTSLAIFMVTMLAASMLHAEDSRWTVRGGGIFVATTGDKATSVELLVPPLTQETITHRVPNGSGFGIGIEYRLTEKIGIEIASLLTTHDSDVVIENDLGTFTATDSLGLSIFTLGANYYWPTDSRFQWSLGGYWTLMFSDDVDAVFPALGNRVQTYQFDQDYGVGVKAALEVPFAVDSPWSISVEGRYMFTILESEVAGGDLDLDPAIVSLNVAYQF